MATVTLTRTTSAPPDVVWEVLTRSADWAEWSDFTDSVREREGTDHPDGVGSVRTGWAAGLVPVREEVVTFEPDTHTYAYRLLSGLPVRDYRSTVTITAEDGGSVISWTASGKPPLPLPLADQASGLAMRVVLGRLVGALAKEAHSRAAAA